MTARSGRSVRRRTMLRAIAGMGTASLAGCSSLGGDDDGETNAPDDDRARELATRFAPTLFFDEYERWFPTDPRPYVRTQDGRTTVDGFDALNGYVERANDADTPPAPTVFYHVVEYEASPLAVVQYWCYSAFDQFTTNFHWHDWEVLHVFVDTETGDPQLYAASAHSRRVPNNEFLDPDPDRFPRLLAELGSHSSGLSVNDRPDRFQRLPTDGSIADINNSPIRGIEALSDLPLAYGLPRDEGSRLPFLVPELDGEPVYEHDRLPAVDRSDLIDEALTIRSYDALTSPPADLPGRRTGLVFRYGDRTQAQSDPARAVEYELVPTRELEDIDAFTGPQLSYEFAVPRFAEDAVASHITTTDAPWTQPRYENPAADVSDPIHRATLADRYDAIGVATPVDSLVATVTRTVPSPEAPDGEGVTTEPAPIEAVALLESDPEAVPTFLGAIAVQGVETGEHRLTVNGGGSAPHSEAVAVTEGVTAAGVDGEIPLVDRADATKLEVDTRGTDRRLTNLAVEDDFGGRLYDAPLSGPDAVYVHRGGAYTTEVRDVDDEVGAFRVTPAATAERVRIDQPRTGKASLAAYLADLATETRGQVAAVADGDAPQREPKTGAGNAVRGLATALGAVAEAARRAAERAEGGDRRGANAGLDAVSTRIETVRERLAAARTSLPTPLSKAADRRLEQATRRLKQAQAAKKL